MHPPSTIQTRMNRRKFLGILAAAGAVGVASAGGYALFEHAPWLDYDGHATQARKPFGGVRDSASTLVELVRYASLAANGHNAPLVRTIAGQSYPNPRVWQAAGKCLTLRPLSAPSGPDRVPIERKRSMGGLG